MKSILKTFFKGLVKKIVLFVVEKIFERSKDPRQIAYQELLKIIEEEVNNWFKK